MPSIVLVLRRSYSAIQGFDRFVEGGLEQIDEPKFVRVPKKKTPVTKKFTGGCESGRRVSPLISLSVRLSLPLDAYVAERVPFALTMICSR